MSVALGRERSRWTGKGREEERKEDDISVEQSRGSLGHFGC